MARRRYRFSLLVRCSLLRLRILEVLIEDDVVVVLLHMLRQPEVFREEADQFVGGPVICDLVWLSSLVLQHDVEELAAVTTSLHLAVDVEI